MKINCLNVFLFLSSFPIPSTSITSAKIQVNGVHLHYQQTGEGSHGVLLLPGMLGMEIRARMVSSKNAQNNLVMYSTPEYGVLSLKNIIATLSTEGKMESCCHQF